MRSKIQRIISAMLCLTFLAACSPQGGAPQTTPQASTPNAATTAPDSSKEPSEQGVLPDYLNLDGYRPIVKEGMEAGFTMAGRVKDADNVSKPEDTWFYKFIDQKLNINLESIEQVKDSAVKDRLALMFASNELPDLMLAFALSTDDLVKYGMGEGQLLALNNYITPELTPTLYALKQELPDAFALATAPDGNLYTIPNMLDTETAYSATSFVNMNWLKGVGLEMPQTLDEYIDMLRAFKDKDPGGVGKDNVIPLGGSYGIDDPRKTLLYAYGFDGADADGVMPAIREGKVVVPAFDPIFGEYLKTMRTLYDEGLIARDFFTLDTTQTRAIASEQRNGVINGIFPYNYVPESFQDWQCLSPLTSPYSTTPVWTGPNKYEIGNIVISSKAENPELIMRFIDWMYTTEGSVYHYNGPSTKAVDDLVDSNYKGWYLEDGISSEFYANMLDENNPYQNNYAVIVGEILLFAGGKTSDRRNNAENFQELFGAEKIGTVLSLENGDGFARQSNNEAVKPFYTSGYPRYVYMDEDTSQQVNDLYHVINNFVIKESTKFITGLRPLEQLEQYFEELKSLGIEEYRQFYADAYQAYSDAEK